VIPPETGTSIHLPSQRSRFLGRTRELSDIVSLLSEESVRLLTITGPGGVGKTRLALKAAEELADSMRDGVCFVPLGPVDTPEDMLQTMASAMGIAFSPSSEPLFGQLRNHLRNRRMLLLLDSFEHLLEANPLVAELHDDACELVLIITSRSPLGVPGETVFELRGMGCSEDDTAGFAGMDDGALDLFEESAARTVPGFRLTWDLQPLAAEICRCLEGLPLAIELATSWLTSMSLAEIYQEIQRNPALLGSGPNHLSARHGSLLEVVDGSWKLLTTQERRVLEALSCFRGSFSAEAACCVAETGPDVLASLSGKSLLRREEGDLLSMHQVTWRYAEQKLRERPLQYSETRQRHCVYFAGMTELLERNQWASGRRALIRELSQNLENTRSAWRWAVSRADAASVGSLLGPLYSLYTNRGWFRDGEKMFAEALKSLEASDEWQGSGRDLVLGTLRLRLGWIDVNLGRYDEGLSLITESLASFRSTGERGLESTALYYLSSLALFRGDFAHAEELGTICLECAVASGDDHRLANAWLAKGNIARRMGRFGDSREFYEESLALYEKLGDDVGRSVCLGNLGITAFRLREMDEALDLSRQSLSIVEELADQRLIAECCCDLGNIYRDIGRLKEAGESYARSLRLNRELGIRGATAITLVNIGLYEKLRGNPRKAEAHMAEAFDIAMALGRKPIAMQTLSHRGWMDLDQGRDASAAAYFSRGLEMMPGFKPVSVSFGVLAGIALLAVRRGDRASALDILGFIMGKSPTPESCEEDCRKVTAAMNPPPTPEETELAIAVRAGTTLEDLALELMETGALRADLRRQTRGRME
jgi:predicted ATPase